MIPFVSSSFLLVGAVALLRAKKTLKKTRKVFRVYVDGCFDLMHFGHANALRQARAIASFASTGGKEGGYVEGAEEVELIVGLVSDEESLRCKGPPVLPERERVKCVRAVKWVDDVITNVPYELTPEFVERLFSGTHVASRRFFCTSLLFSSLFVFVFCLGLLGSFRMTDGSPISFCPNIPAAGCSTADG